MATNHGPVTEANLYTTGDKLLKPGGSPYYGWYHIHQDGTYMTGKDHVPGNPMYKLTLKYNPLAGIGASMLAGIMGKDKLPIPLTPDGKKLILEEEQLKKDAYKPLLSQTLIKKYPNKKYTAVIDTTIHELINISAVAPIKMERQPDTSWLGDRLSCVIGYEINLTCEAISNKGLTLTYQWTKDGEVTTNVGVDLQTITITADTDQSGFWACEIIDDDENILISNGVYVDVIDPSDIELFGGNIIKNGDAKQDLSYWQVVGPIQPVPLSLDLDAGRYNLNSSVQVSSNVDSDAATQQVGYDAFKWSPEPVFDDVDRNKYGIPKKNIMSYDPLTNLSAVPTDTIPLVKPEDRGYRPDKNARYFYGGWGTTSAKENWKFYIQEFYSTMRQDIDLSEIAEIVDSQDPTKAEVIAATYLGAPYVAAQSVPGGSGSIKGIEKVSADLWGWLGSVGWTEHISKLTSHMTHNPSIAKNRSVPADGYQSYTLFSVVKGHEKGDELARHEAPNTDFYHGFSDWTNTWTYGQGFTDIHPPLTSAPQMSHDGGDGYIDPNGRKGNVDTHAVFGSSIWWDYRHTTCTSWQRTQVHDKVYVSLDFYDANETILNTISHQIENYQYYRDLPHSLWYVLYTARTAPWKPPYLDKPYGGKWANVLNSYNMSRTTWDGKGYQTGDDGNDLEPFPNINSAPNLPSSNAGGANFNAILKNKYVEALPQQGSDYKVHNFTGLNIDKANGTYGTDEWQLGKSGWNSSEQGSTYYGDPNGTANGGKIGGQDFTRTLSTDRYTNTANRYGNNGWDQHQMFGVNVAGFHGYPYKHIRNKSRFFYSDNLDIDVPPLTRKAVITIKWERDKNRGFTYSRLGEKYNPNKIKNSPPDMNGTYGLEFMCGVTNLGCEINVTGVYPLPGSDPPTYNITPSHMKVVSVAGEYDINI